MNDTVVVRGFDRFGDLLGQWNGILDRDRTLAQSRRQGLTLDEPEDQILTSVRFCQPVDRAKACMTEEPRALASRWKRVSRS
jgi:hypothetical protein